jgi:hypothetical protein
VKQIFDEKMVLQSIGHEYNIKSTSFPLKFNCEVGRSAIVLLNKDLI